MQLTNVTGALVAGTAVGCATGAVVGAAGAAAGAGAQATMTIESIAKAVKTANFLANNAFILSPPWKSDSAMHRRAASEQTAKRYVIDWIIWGAASPPLRKGKPSAKLRGLYY